MKKFGIGKKDKSSEDDPNRSRLFGKSRSKAESPAPASTNPYAVQQSSSTPDPYVQSSQSYGQSRANGGLAAPSGGSGYGPSRSLSTNSQDPHAQPPPYTGGGGYSGDRSRNDKSPVPSGGYGAPRYGNTGYGNQSGYGGDKFGTSTANDAHSIVSSRPGGYGGMGLSGSQETLDTQSGRDALFGGAKERLAKQEQSAGLPPEEDPARGYDGGAGAMDMGYGTYQDRQLTAEEEEEEDVQATKSQIRAIKQQDVSSTRNALRIAEEAEQTGRETLERLGAQGERIHNTEKNLDLAANQNRLAEEKARELKHLNRSMWAMHVGNPFTASRRDREREEQIITQHHSDRTEREATRAATYQSANRREEQARSLRDSGGMQKKKGNLAERSKYQFEADSEDEAMEDEIDANLDALGGAAKRLNQLGRAMGDEVDKQNVIISGVASKADRVDDQIALNRGRLDRIERRG